MKTKMKTKKQVSTQGRFRIAGVGVATGALMGAFALLAVGCASLTGSAINTQDMAVAAGFKAITASTTAQKNVLAGLPAGKVTPIKHDGKQYYVVPGTAKGQAFVGGPNQYQAYQQARMANNLTEANLETAQLTELDEEESLGGWGGWGYGWDDGWGGW
jgi:hypothetical protein